MGRRFLPLRPVRAARCRGKRCPGKRDWPGWGGLRPGPGPLGPELCHGGGQPCGSLGPWAEAQRRGWDAAGGALQAGRWVPCGSRPAAVPLGPTKRPQQPLVPLWGEGLTLPSVPGHVLGQTPCCADSAPRALASARCWGSRAVAFGCCGCPSKVEKGGSGMVFRCFPSMAVLGRGESPLISAGGMPGALQSIRGHLHNRLWLGLSCLSRSCRPVRD